MADLSTVEREATLTSIGVTADQLFRANPSRGWLYIGNLSANTLFARPTRTATTISGFRIASGGFRLLWWEEDYELPTLEWSIIADGAGSALYAVEILFQRTTVRALLEEFLGHRITGIRP